MLHKHEPEYRSVSIADIQIDGTLQMRESMSNEHIEDIILGIEAEDEFEPVVVYSIDGSLVMADGFHRLEAAKRKGLANIWAEIVAGTRTDALLHAVGANANHGLKRTWETKRRQIRTCIELQPEWSDRQIAKHVCVSRPTVASVRRDMNGKPDPEPKAKPEPPLAKEKASGDAASELELLRDCLARAKTMFNNLPADQLIYLPGNSIGLLIDQCYTAAKQAAMAFNDE